MDMKYVLVTGATGFIGAHIVDELLSRGIRVRGATRSPAKGQQMLDARPHAKGCLDFVQIQDFTGSRFNFDEAVKGVDGVIHVASPLSYTVTNPVHDLILPAIAGVHAILASCHRTPTVRRLVLTSSFAAVLDLARGSGPGFTYTGSDWAPLTYADAAAPSAGAVVAYRGSKKFAELAAWEFVAKETPAFDLVTLCPPMTFGPVAHPLGRPEELNESNATLWRAAMGEEPLPEARVPVWIDVRDLARAHVEALVREGVVGRRYVPCAEERYSYELAWWVMRERFGERVPVGRVRRNEEGEKERPVPRESYGLDWTAVERELGVKGRGFEECVGDFVEQMLDKFPDSCR